MKVLPWFLFCWVCTTTVLVAQVEICDSNCNIVLEEQVTFISIYAKQTAAILQITKCDKDPAETVHSFWARHSTNRFVLQRLLDFVCVGRQLPCKVGTVLLRETFAAVPKSGEIIVRLGDSVNMLVADQLAQLPPLDSALVNSREFIMMRKICAVLPFTCTEQDIVAGQTSTTTRLQLDATFETVEQVERVAMMETLTTLAGDVDFFGMAEGNLWTDASQSADATLRKRECSLFAVSLLVPAPTTYLEVGFNAGHSLSMFLSALPNLKRAVEFDICEHAYVRSNFQAVEKKFSQVNISLICGDSKVTLGDNKYTPTILFGQNKMADIIHIDGGHDFDTAWLDIVNARRFARPSSTLLIIDNVDHSRSLEGAVAAAVDSGVISIVGGETGACRYGSVHAYYL